MTADNPDSVKKATSDVAMSITNATHMPPNAETGTRRPRVLDLFCGAGGAAMGWAMAGCEVVGVDIKPQPAYPFEFHQDDAMALLLDAYSPAGDFDIIHASPPCQRYTRVTRWRGRAEDHPDFLDIVVDALRAKDVAWVVENVPEAIPDPDLMLCGSMFGLSVRRHRHFLASTPLKAPPDSCRHGDLFPFMHKGERSYADAMECGWMTSHEAREGIPPAYTRWIAGRALEALGCDVPSYSRWAQCLHCGKAFPCERSDARYCCSRCRNNASYRRTTVGHLEPVSVRQFERQGRLMKASHNDGSGTASAETDPGAN